jgi:hypothetical protein
MPSRWPNGAPAAHGDLAEEMAHSEPRTLVWQFDLDLAGSDEIHRVSRLAAARDDRAGLNLLGPQLDLVDPWGRERMFATGQLIAETVKWAA